MLSPTVHSYTLAIRLCVNGQSCKLSEVVYTVLLSCCLSIVCLEMAYTAKQTLQRTNRRPNRTAYYPGNTCTVSRACRAAIARQPDGRRHTLMVKSYMLLKKAPNCKTLGITPTRR